MKKNDKITSREVDFAKWYTDVIREADLVDYGNTKGSMIIRPYGYAIWEKIVAYLDKEFKKTGVMNVQMPMFIPESLLNIEKDHVEGFAPEAAWVTHGGNDKLEERMCVRPTSEVLFCEHFKKIVKSYRDLPLLYNQWCTIVRWEKTTRPFLRSREILWQEGHTLHAEANEAQQEALDILKIYEDFQKNILGLPVLVGKKSEKEKFAGAVETYTLEAMMYDGVALQNGTTHYFGDKFTKAFGIEYLNKENKLVNPHQSSWGVTTRMIGGLIMTHSDDNGLVLPPNIAPIQVCIIKIGDNDLVNNKISELKKVLEEKNITYKVDDSDKSPGFKFAEAEVKGYPLRLEIGARDLENDIITIVRRDTSEKITTSSSDYINKIVTSLKNMQEDMYQKALTRRNEMIYEANSKEEFEKYTKQPGFTTMSWCNNRECEDKIKEDYKVKTRCIKEEGNFGTCPICGKEAKVKMYFGKQY